MTISGVTDTSTSSTSTTTTGSSELGRDDFLNLLVTQLQYQDPLNPMDSADFTAQLAQFSSLEQLTNMNEQLEALVTAQSNLNNSQAVSYIGRTVLAEGNATFITDGDAEPLQIELEESAAEVYVGIYDDTGDLVSTLSTDAMAAGRGTIEWDGTDMDGNALPDGDYWFEVTAVDSSGDEVEVSTLSSGQVSGVSFGDDGEASLVVKGQSVSLDAIIEVIQGEADEDS